MFSGVRSAKPGSRKPSEPQDNLYDSVGEEDRREGRCEEAIISHAERGQFRGWALTASFPASFCEYAVPHPKAMAGSWRGQDLISLTTNIPHRCTRLSPADVRSGRYMLEYVALLSTLRSQGHRWETQRVLLGHWGLGFLSLFLSFCYHYSCSTEPALSGRTREMVSFFHCNVGQKRVEDGKKTRS